VLQANRWIRILAELLRVRIYSRLARAQAIEPLVTRGSDSELLPQYRFAASLQRCHRDRSRSRSVTVTVPV
jgi:hypothetical protein